MLARLLPFVAALAEPRPLAGAPSPVLLGRVALVIAMLGVLILRQGGDALLTSSGERLGS